jgi:hypothetical protein
MPTPQKIQIADKKKILKITSAEAQEHQLPGVDIELDPAGFTVSLYPDPKTYIRLLDSTGNSGFQIQSFSGVSNGRTGIREFIIVRYKDEIFSEGSVSNFNLQKLSWLAMPLLTGTKEKLNHRCLIFFPRIPSGTAGVVVEFWEPLVFGKVLPIQEAAKKEPFKTILASLKVSFGKN